MNKNLYRDNHNLLIYRISDKSMKALFYILFISLLFGQLSAQQTDLHQRSFNYDLDALGKPPDYNYFWDLTVGLSIDNIGIVLDKLRSNYYNSRGGYSRIMRIKNPKLGLISNTLKEKTVAIQPYYINQKMLGDRLRRQTFTDAFDDRIASVLSEKIENHLRDSIGFKNLILKDALALGEGDFESRIQFKGRTGNMALFLTFASNYLATPLRNHENERIDLIFGYIENHKGKEYLHIELILNEDKSIVFKTAINIFLDWRNINVDEFAKNNYLLNEIMTNLFHEIYTE